MLIFSSFKKRRLLFRRHRQATSHVTLQNNSLQHPDLNKCPTINEKECLNTVKKSCVVRLSTIFDQLTCNAFAHGLDMAWTESIIFLVVTL